MQKTNDNMRKWLTLIALVSVSSNNASAATINAADTSAAAVQTAIKFASDGDTVTIPAGTGSWTTTVTCSKSIVIQGAGIDQTIITDHVPRTKPNFGIEFSFTGSGTWRLTGFTIKYGTVTDMGSHGSINVPGSSHAFRIDHVKFNDVYNRGIETTGDLWGVIDHCTFSTSRGAVGIQIGHFSWQGVGSHGDNSWAQPTNLGTSQFIFVEDNIYLCTAAGVQDFVDGAGGSRYVVRHNTTTNGSIGGGHGTDSTGRTRSVRVFEIYNNTMNATSSFPMASYMRGGTGVIYSNTMTNFQYAVQASNYRDVDSFAPWGACNGISPWHTTDGVLYVSGTHNGGNGVALVLTDASKNFTTACSGGTCVGYSVTNSTQTWSSVIASVTTTTATATGSNYNVAHNW